MAAEPTGGYRGGEMKIKRPNAILYFIVYILLYPLLKILFRLEVDRSNYDPPKGPYVVISNHVSFMDFILVMLSLYPRRFNAVAAQKFYFYKPLNVLLPLMGCIPKNLFDPDVRSIIGIKKVLQRGDRILLFPEGRCTVAGAYMGIHKSTGKLIKRLDVPVVSCHIEGAYTCMPFWRKGLRFGREKITIAGLFTAEDTGTMSVDEINAAIDRRLGGYDTKPPKKPFHTFSRRKLLEGLHNIIYWCPKCGRELTLTTSKNTIQCTACGNTATIDKYAKLTPAPGSIVPDTIQGWYCEQSKYESQQLSDDMEPISIQVTVRVPISNARGIAPCGKGMLSLGPEGWRYDGEMSGESVSMFFPIDSVPALPFDPDDNFQIYSKGSFYAFTPDDKRLCAKYATIGECAYWRFASPIMMTLGRDAGFNGNSEFGIRN